VKGIVEDDLPYSLGEKSGMSKLFNYLLPRGILTPSHQTVRRDLDVLYDKLDDKLNQRLKVHIVFAVYYLHTLIYLFSIHSQIALRLRLQVIYGQAKTLSTHLLAPLPSGLMTTGT